MPVFAASSDDNIIVVAIVSGPLEAQKFDTIIRLMGEEMHALRPVTAAESATYVMNGANLGRAHAY
jgi:hypothetical protein